ncbi:GGDEF domain-containing protein, partial [Bacillus cereus]|nr:GGDEF domain-containing protein [Bacillus cereus]
VYTIYFTNSKKSIQINFSIALLITFIYHLTVILGISGYNLNSIGDMLFLALFFGLFLLFNDSPAFKQILFYSACIGLGIATVLINNNIISTVMVIMFTIGTGYFLLEDIPYRSKARWILYLFGTSKLVWLFSSKLPWLASSSAMLMVASYIVVLTINVEHFTKIMIGTYESSISDSLTGLYNREYFTKCVQQCVIKGLPASMIFIDVDDFKKLNDTQGHDKGDEVLQKVAMILNDEMNGNGIAARYGGEEIVALIVEPSIDVEELAERVRERIQNEASFVSSAGEYSVSVSIGCSSIDRVVKYGSEEYLIYDKRENL